MPFGFSISKAITIPNQIKAKFEDISKPIVSIQSNKSSTLPAMFYGKAKTIVKKKTTAHKKHIAVSLIAKWDSLKDGIWNKTKPTYKK